MFVTQRIRRFSLSPHTLLKGVAVLCTLLLLGYVAARMDAGNFMRYFSAFSLGPVLAATGLLVANQLVSTLRFAAFLDIRPRGRDFIKLNYANSASILAGVVFFNVIGQGIARSRFLHREGLGSDGFVVTGLERAASLAVLLGLAMTGALFAFHGISIAPDGVTELASIAGGMAVAALAVFVYLHRSGGLRLLARIVDALFVRRIVRAMAFSIVMHMLMALAYLQLAGSALGTIDFARTAAIIPIIMLAASLPISFAGWGVRELSAAAAFGAIGLPEESGIAVAVMLGILAILATVVNFGVSAILARRNAGASSWSATAPRLSNPTKAVAFALAIPVFALIGFFIKLPTSSGAVTLNLADPFAILAGLSVAFHLAYTARFPVFWRLPGLSYALGAAALVVLLAGLHGFVRFGVTDWALYNRMTGALVLAAYVLAGAAVPHFYGTTGARIALGVFAVSLSACVLLEIIARAAGLPPFATYFSWTPVAIGFTGNRNAFAFLSLIGVAVVAILVWRRSGAAQGRWIPVAALFLAAVILSGSRTGIFSASVLAVILMWWRVFPAWPLLLWTGGLLAANVALPPALHQLAAAFGGAGFGDGGFTSLFPNGAEGLLSVQKDRIASILGGVAMWWDHPLFGGGLGAFMHQQIAATGKPLVIHASALWALAETGLIGTLVLLAAPFLLARRLWRTPRAEWDGADLGLFLIFVVLALMSVFHDMLYQRAFWLLFGFCAAAGRQNRPAAAAGT